jgi:molecular chaperone HscC
LDAVKRQLSVNDRVEAVLQLHGREVPISLSVDDLNQQVEPLLQKLLKPIEQSIRDSRIQVGNLEDVILVGGATRMPIIRQFVTRLFGRFPSCHLDPDHVVVMGAAIQAALKQRNEELDDVVLTDVCPFSMGIEIVGGMEVEDRVGGIYSVILERNMVIPVSREERFYTVSDNQKAINVRVFQGESRLVENNIELGNIDVKVPRKKAGEESVDVRFTYDINGLLEVIVKVVSTGKEDSLVIQSSSNRMSESEIKKALRKLDKIKIHPRDKAANQALMSRAERLFEERLGEERDSIGALILGFEKVLQTQDERKIEMYVEEMKQMLDSLEADMWQ